MLLAQLSAGFQSLPLLPTANWALLVLIPGWVCVCVCSRPPWVFPMNSPVSLGVYPAAASTPTGVFSQRFEVLFPHAGTLGCEVCLAPQLFLLVYLHENVGLPSPQSTTSLAPATSSPVSLSLACPVLQRPPCREFSPPCCPSPPLLPVWMNGSSLAPWLSDFHTVRFSVSSGCFWF